MRWNNTAIYDCLLQVAAIAAVLFVFNAGMARGAMPPMAERIVIEEALRAGVSPSVALAVSTLNANEAKNYRAFERQKIRSEIEIIGALLRQHPGEVRDAVTRYRRVSAPGSFNVKGYVSAVQALVRRFDAEARAAARALKAPVPRGGVVLDDFNATITLRLKRARRTLDDFPLRRRS